MTRNKLFKETVSNNVPITRVGGITRGRAVTQMGIYPTIASNIFAGFLKEDQLQGEVGVAGLHGIAVCESGGSFSYGDELTLDANGCVVELGAPTAIFTNPIGFALEDNVGAGNEVYVYVVNPLLQGGGVSPSSSPTTTP